MLESRYLIYGFLRRKSHLVSTKPTHNITRRRNPRASLVTVQTIPNHLLAPACLYTKISTHMIKRVGLAISSFQRHLQCEFLGKRSSIDNRSKEPLVLDLALLKTDIRKLSKLNRLSLLGRVDWRLQSANLPQLYTSP